MPLTFDGQAWQPFAPLAGVSLEVDISTGSGKSAGAFREDLLWTHRGLSGPAVLQISELLAPGHAHPDRLVRRRGRGGLVARTEGGQPQAPAPICWPSGCRRGWRTRGARRPAWTAACRCMTLPTRHCVGSGHR
ncbi:hypothetical protein ACTMU2_32625 [Cupriavidus basilensis]